MNDRTAGTFGEQKLIGFDELEWVGSGGFSTVFKAYQRDFDRLVAVKVLRLDVSEAAARADFERECALAGRLSDHPNIVTTHGGGFTADGQPYIVMEFFARGNAADLLAATGPLPVAEVLRIGVKMCGALASSHALGVVHRDVKPQNILMSSYGEPALGDFGIATLAAGSGTESVAYALTIAHAAPEVITGSEASVESDIYSLSSTLYEFLAGRKPFPHALEEPERWRQAVAVGATAIARPDLPASLQHLLARGLDPDPAERPASAETMGRALVGVQRELGLAPTELTTRTEPRVVTPEPADLLRSVPRQRLATPEATQVVRSAPLLRPELVTEPRPAPSANRRRMAAVLAGVVVLAAGACALLLLLPKGSKHAQPAAGSESLQAKEPAATASASTNVTAPSTGAGASAKSPVTPQPQRTVSLAANQGDVSAPGVWTRGGPAEDYAASQSVAQGTVLTVICTAYGSPVGPSANALWDYTNQGWVADHYLHTGTAEAIAPACGGTVDQPSAGGSAPSRENGPFAVRTAMHGYVHVHSYPDLADSSVIAAVHDGDLVTIACYEDGPVPVGTVNGEGDWDRLDSPAGYMYDSYVASYTNGSGASHC